MITITSSVACMLYVLSALAIIFLLWFRDHRKRSKTDPLPPLLQLYTCEFCTSPYLDEKERTVTRCPLCHSYNKKP